MRHSTTSPAVVGFPRVLRGALAAIVAVGTAALAHTAGGHHAPHGLVLALTLALSVPLCCALAAVRLSRARLAAGVLISQSILHGLFELFPAHSSPAAGAEHAAEAAQMAGHGAAGHTLEGQGALLHAGSGAGQSAAIESPDAGVGMILAHCVAALISYGLLRRGEVIVEALVALLGLVPVLVLALAGPQPRVRRVLRQPRGEAGPPLTAVWPGDGPRTVRGPPPATS